MSALPKGLLLALALLGAEYLLLGWCVDLRDLGFLARTPWLLEGAIRYAGPLIVCIASALLVLGGRGFRAAFVGPPAAPLPQRGAWLFAQLTLYILFFALTLALARQHVAATTLSSAAWLLLALASGMAWIMLAIPGTGVRWLRGAGLRVGCAAAAVGGLSVVAGFVSEAAWSYVAFSSVWACGHLLALAPHPVFVDYAEPSIRLHDFAVQIAPACSGLEGMGLMLVLVAAYLFAFRRDLKFPRALSLLPIGLALAFVANVVRISALVLVGAYLSWDLAEGGFHSKVGWIAFSLLAVVLILASKRALTREPVPSRPAARPLVVGPLARYLVPELCLLATALLTGLWAVGIDRLMALRFLTSGAALVWLSRPVLGKLRVSMPALSVGLLAYALWIALAKHDTRNPDYEAFLRTHATLEVSLFLLSRVLGSVLIVPVVEELLFRGFLARWPSGADFEAVRPAYISMQGLLLSSCVFGLLHSDTIAGVATGLAYGLLYRRTENLADSIVAHAVTNALIAIEVLWLGHYGRW